jgi:hypothetical protein
MYKAGAAGAGAADAGQTAGSDEGTEEQKDKEDVVEAEFEETDKDKKE